MGEVAFEVRGVAPVFGGSTRWLWRRRLGEAATRARDGMPDAAPAGPFELAVVFFLLPLRLEHNDLDNMAKPILDTLFWSGNVQVAEPGLTGTLFAVPDSRVFRMTVEKRSVDRAADEGVHITVRW